MFRSKLRRVNFAACICGVTQTTLTVLSVVQSSACSYDHVTIAHLSYIKHVVHITSRYIVLLLLKLTVNDHDTSITTATPELLVDDTQTARP